ncbi:uncharacterized protein LOC132624493 [Lycium barbarum]|uniref:uncharacterized protein LOC132624493 n=1 Tax=Lycium barbarum TaxID=112863 RepID=UPI00293E17A9|nr:uncharacterized protein LOC132624493 [Lycium barbarum]
MMIKSFIWNIRSVKTQKAFHRLQMLQRHHKFMFIALLEPFQNARHIHKYRRRLNMSLAAANYNGKIWYFTNDVVDVEVLMDTAQQVTLKLHLLEEDRFMIVTLVYAKSCELFKVGYRGSPFTWWNGRVGDDCIFERLDRLLVNQELQNWFGNLEVQHISRPFRFLEFWVENETFKDVVQQHWISEATGNPYIDFKRKLKNVKLALKQWSKETFGDIFKQLEIREDIVKIKEQLFEDAPTDLNRMVLHKAQAEFKRYLHFEEEFWRQKSGYNWFEEGERNTRFFHNLNQFTQEGDNTEFSLLQHIPELISAEDNSALCIFPNLEEVKKAVFELNGDSASGPDGFTGCFFQTCWEIVGSDVLNITQAFFYGHTLPKSITHTNLILLPKKNEVITFSDMRPISLSNFINKVLSRVVHDRLDKVLPSLISANQSGFVKGRNIIENVLLTQKIVTDIRKRGKPANVIIKLDMTKAYDKVSWLFLTRVLVKMGFANGFVDMVWSLLANSWYSILINGQAHGFFHSTKGVKQGDPHSPALFILSAEVLTRALNALFDNDLYKGFGMPKWSANLNHLAFADDTIMFASADKTSLDMIMQTLHEYENQSGQKINKQKSAFYMHRNVPDALVDQVQQKRRLYYADVIKKVKDRLQAWKGRILSYGGKAVLIASVLQSIPIHLLSVIVPPKCVILEIHKMFAKFFWSNKEEGKCRHWSSWPNVFLPKDECGLGFRSIFDVSKSMFAKLWWKFRTGKSLWVNFMWNKYCKKHIPSLVQGKGGSQLWKMMLENREVIEKQMWWEPRNGAASLWYDNWSRLGPLHMQDGVHINNPDAEVKDILERGGWNINLMQSMIPGYVVEHVKQYFSNYTITDECDHPWWLMTTSGKFSVSSAWELLRNRRNAAYQFRNIWVKGLPFKISFFLWRLWKAKLPIDEVLAKTGTSVVSRCLCCPSPQLESMDHLFLTGIFATRVWKYYTDATVIQGPFIQVKQAVHKWWESLPVSWPYLVQCLEECRPFIGLKLFQWNRPNFGWYKCNTNGASRGNSGPSSTAFCVRNHEGDLICAKGRGLPDSTNIVAEAVAIKEGLEFASAGS